MWTILYFYFCIHYSMLTTKNLLSIYYHTVDFFYWFHPPLCPFPSGKHYFFLCIYVFVSVWFDFCLFVFYILYVNKIIWCFSSYVWCKYPSTSIHVVANGSKLPGFYVTILPGGLTLYLHCIMKKVIPVS